MVRFRFTPRPQAPNAPTVTDLTALGEPSPKAEAGMPPLPSTTRIRSFRYKLRGLLRIHTDLAAKVPAPRADICAPRGLQKHTLEGTIKGVSGKATSEMSETSFNGLLAALRRNTIWALLLACAAALVVRDQVPLWAEVSLGGFVFLAFGGLLPYCALRLSRAHGTLR